MKVKICQHLQAAADTDKTAKDYCEECVKTGTEWVHLRTCLTCGKTHCCDSSPEQHATKHFQASGHPVIKSAEPGETWRWCYEDELMQK